MSHLPEEKNNSGDFQFMSTPEKVSVYVAAFLGVKWSSGLTLRLFSYTLNKHSLKIPDMPAHIFSYALFLFIFTTFQGRYYYCHFVERVPEVKWLTQRHRGSKWKSQDLNPSLSDCQVQFLPLNFSCFPSVKIYFAPKNYKYWALVQPSIS